MFLYSRNRGFVSTKALTALAGAGALSLLWWMTGSEDSLELEDWGQEGYGATGLYEFFYLENGMQVRHPARFSFMVKFDPTQKIQHHHSSLIPDS